MNEYDKYIVHQQQQHIYILIGTVHIEIQRTHRGKRGEKKK